MSNNRQNICGERIAESRQKGSLSQAEVAAAMDVEFGLNIDRSDISEIERGVRGVKDYELDAIARILEVSPLFLLRGNED
ncbi:helix-turn-helix domain-containing protein [Porticoccus sp. GXU_MW_L64]